MKRLFVSNFFLKVFLGYLLITLTLSGLVFFATTRIIRHNYIASMQSKLLDISRSTRDSIASGLISGKIEPINRNLFDLSKELHIRFTIINPDGNVLIDSETDPIKMENHKFRKEVMEAFSGEYGTAIRYSATEKKDMLYVAIPVMINNRIIAVFRSSMYLREIQGVLNDLFFSIVRITLFIILIGSIAIVLFAKNITDPIRELSKLSQKVADGDFSVRSYTDSKDPEILDLLETFNQMTSRIQSLFTEISLRKEELDVIILSMKDGLLVLDSDDRIVLFNPSFAKIIGHDLNVGVNYWELIRIPAFFDLVEKVRNGLVNSTSEISLNEKTYVCTSINLEQKKQVLYIFYDITESKRFENIKKDFIANVSHELRTPLTAIMGFAETLQQDESNPEKSHYLEIIKRHTDRLVKIVEDILILSQLESDRMELNFSTVNLKSLFQDLQLLFQPRLNEKRLSLTINIGADCPSIKADAFRLEQVFQNLLDNALKYTDKGEITVSAAVNDSEIVVSIKDTGIGIPETAIPRLFERFYVVDKSRSRQTGGTGLGLSIVKHIILQHNGRIEVKSQVGYGTVFSVFLPFSQASS